MGKINELMMLLKTFGAIRVTMMIRPDGNIDTKVEILKEGVWTCAKKSLTN